MTCPNCKFDNPEGTLFCKQCNSFIPDAVVLDLGEVYVPVDKKELALTAAKQKEEAQTALAAEPPKDSGEPVPPYFLAGPEPAAISDLSDTTTPDRVAPAIEATPEPGAAPTVESTVVRATEPAIEPEEVVLPVTVVARTSTSELPPLVVKAIKFNAETSTAPVKSPTGPLTGPIKTATGPLIRAIKAPTGPLTESAASAPGPELIQEPAQVLPTISLAPGGLSDDTSPFEDYLPGLPNSDQPKPASTRQSRLLKPVHVAPVSIDELLEETAKPKRTGLTGPLTPSRGTGPLNGNRPTGPLTPGSGTGPLPLNGNGTPQTGRSNEFRQTGALTASAATAAPPVPPPAAVPPSPTDPLEGLPVPNYQMPPLWFKPPSEIGWTEVKKTEAPRELPSAKAGSGIRTENRERLGLSVAGPDFGVERGIYYYTDFNDDLRVFELAGFFRRLAGAAIDSVIATVIAVIVVFVVTFFFANLRFSINNFLLYVLIIESLTVFFNFGYHAFLVGLTGQSIGHRVMKIKVMRLGGRGVGLISGVKRAFYGMIPSITALVVLLVVPLPPRGQYGGPLPLPGYLMISVWLLIAFGMGWAFISKKRQGWHDKLAKTYVLNQEEMKIPG